MLQIISGRFFKEGPINERESDAILYSNYQYADPIVTRVVQMRAAGYPAHRVSGYVLRYTNRYQPTSPSDVIILPMAYQAVEQFRLLASFWFKSTFHADREYVERLCRPDSRHNLDTTVPARFVPDFFDAPRTGAGAEAEGFAGFMETVIGLARKDYNRLLVCLGAFFDALEALGTNFDLAYSILVYVLECLSNAATGFVPVWEEYDQNIRVPLDKQFAALPPDATEAIRAILLSTPHQKAKKRFIEFILSNVNDSFFTTEAAACLPALPKNDLQRALDTLYNVRSGYVHELRAVEHQLKVPFMAPRADVFRWQNEPYFTFAGLVRLTHHVIASFIKKQPQLECEDYPWRSELPGMMEGEMAPEYWLWKTDRFHPAQARKRFDGFLHFLVQKMHTSPIADLRLGPVMQKIEGSMHQAKLRDQRAMLALYRLYTHIYGSEERLPKVEKLLASSSHALTKCCIETMVLSLFIPEFKIGQVSDWEVAFEGYLREKYSPTGFCLPTTLEIAIEATIANQHLAASDKAQFERWVQRGILDAAGQSKMQEYLAQCHASQESVDLMRLLDVPMPKEIPAADGCCTVGGVVCGPRTIMFRETLGPGMPWNGWTGTVFRVSVSMSGEGVQHAEDSRLCGVGLHSFS